MATAVGLQTVFGTSEEVTYGTPVVVDRWYEILSEGLERQNQILTSNGLRAGTRNLRRGSRRVLSARSGMGDVTLEVATTGMGRWFQHMLGGTPVVAQQGATAAYLHTYTLGSLAGKSLTVQKGLRDEAGTTVSPFTFHGCKVTSWEFTISVDQILQVRVSLDSEDVDTSTALAAHSYGSTKLFHFAQGTLKVAGSSVARVLDSTVSGDNALKTDSYFLGSGGLKAEPAPNDYPSVTGSLTGEFLDRSVFYDRFAADSSAELILEFVGAVIAGAHNERLTIKVPDVRFTGETPKVGGPDLVMQNVPWEGQFDGTNPGVTIEYMTTDVAV